MFKTERWVRDGQNCIRVSGLGPYSLADTLECGQCFRQEQVEDKSGYREYITVVGNTVVRVGQDSPGTLYFFDIEEGEGDWEAVREYFALDFDLDEIRKDILSRTDSVWLARAAERAGGIAILRQDPWETLVSFIISQNNNIPRIRKIIRQICAGYGVNITLQNGGKVCPAGRISGTPCDKKCRECGICYTFPTPRDILENPDGLLPSRPGFRYGYILDAARQVYSGEVRLDMIAADRSYSHTLECLKQIRGVGDKVASCVALFGFGNLEAFPIDVWMRRAIDEYFDGHLDPATLGRYAGVAQQYIFHYIRNMEPNSGE